MSAPLTPANEAGSGVRFRRVVCGIDGSEEALLAARQALALAEDGAEYWGVAAWDPGVAVHAGIHAAEVADDLRQDAAAALARARREVAELQPVRVRGRDVPALLEVIMELRADLVAVGSHGRSRIAGWNTRAYAANPRGTMSCIVPRHGSSMRSRSQAPAEASGSHSIGFTLQRTLRMPQPASPSPRATRRRAAASHARYCSSDHPDCATSCW